MVKRVRSPRPVDADSGNAQACAHRIAILLPSLEGGGAERSMLNLAAGLLARGRAVDIVVCKDKGAYRNDVPAGARLVVLDCSGALEARLFPLAVRPDLLWSLLRPVVLAKKTPSEMARLKSLRDYLAAGKTDVMISALPYANLLALWARKAAGARVPLIITERIALLTYCRAPDNFRKWRWRYLPPLLRRSYPQADRVVTVSDSVARELIDELGLPNDSVTTIYNPVVDDSLTAGADEDPGHTWFADGEPPVVLGVGRLTEQKGFATLIQAFARLRQTREARLVLLGEGRLRGDLEQQARALGISDYVDMPGFVDNPFKYMAHATVTALSSEYEGLPGVLIQAMACGCPVVSTDCPGGSREILDGGRYGRLVPVGDAGELAAALDATLQAQPDSDVLVRRAQDFSLDRGVDNYLSLADSLCARALRAS
jgi:glycosyltransferase involved in cell wall biosynthesis